MSIENMAKYSGILLGVDHGIRLILFQQPALPGFFLTWGIFCDHVERFSPWIIKKNSGLLVYHDRKWHEIRAIQIFFCHFSSEYENSFSAACKVYKSYHLGMLHEMVSKHVLHKCLRVHNTLYEPRLVEFIYTFLH